MNIEEVVSKAFSNVTKNKDVSKETLIKDLGIDSLDLVESLMSIEEELGIEFNDEEMMGFKTVGDVFTVIEKKVN